MTEEVRKHTVMTLGINTLPNVQSHKSPQFNNSFMCQGLKEYGKLSQWAKDMSSLKGFVKQLKRDILKI